MSPHVNRAPLFAALTVALALTACGRDVVPPSGPRTTPRDPVATISDGAHQGNTHFFFLPPLVPAPSYSGTPDGSLAPQVGVCEWNATSNRCGTIVAQFSTTTGTGSETVRFDATGKYFMVNWKTDQCLGGPCTLDQSKQYRLRVSVGAAELGFADVQMVPNASALKNVNTGETIALVDGRTLPVKFRIEQGAVAVLNGNAANIGSSGGSVTTADGSAAIQIPTGALALETAITVASTTGPTDFAPTVNLGPDGTHFATPVTLTLPYEPTRLPPGALPSDLAIYTFDGTGWIEVPNGSVDESNATVSAPISHFSSYSVYLRPNTVTGTPTPTTIKIGQTTVASANAWYYYTNPAYQYCYPIYSYRYTGWGNWTRYISGWQCYYTPATSYSYPVNGMAVYWSSSNAAIASVPTGPTYTNSNGVAQSPSILGLKPGSADVRGTISGAPSSNPLTITVLGQLGLLPRTANVVAGWSVRQQITQTVALPNAVPVSLTNRNGFLVIGESGTSNYTYGGQTGTYVINAGSVAKDLVIAGLNGPGVDTLIASSAGFSPDTAIITLVQGKFLVTGWPTQLQVGDSAALAATVADQNGALGNLGYPIDVNLAPTSGLVFTNGSSTITTLRIQQRTSATFYLKAINQGANSAVISHRDYVDYSNAINVAPPPLVGPQRVCGHSVTGIGFDGTYYYVGEGHDGLLQCLSRFSAATGYLVDSKQILLDHRGVHWVQSLGALTSRTWGGPIYKIDYATGVLTQIASNPTVSRPGDEQSAPAVDPDGTSYWILNNGQAERHRLSDHALLKVFPVASTATNNVIAVSNQWVFVLDGAGVNAYSKASNQLVGRQPLPHAHPCNYYGFGVSASADRIMYMDSDCRHVEIVPVTVTFAEPPPVIGAQSMCGHTITGVGFDGTYYYVAEGHDGLLQCLSRFVATTGALADTRKFFVDHRGMHWVQSLGKLTSRTWGGPIYKMDFVTGAVTELTSNPTQSRPGDEQSQPAVDADGQSYWILTNGQAERRRLSDKVLLKTFPVTTTATNNVIAASDQWVFVLDGAGANAYSKVSGALSGRQPLPHAHPCNYYGFGVSANADRILYTSDCRHMEVVPITVTFTEPQFSLLDLGVASGYAWSEARAINGTGRIVGQGGNSFPSWAGFYWDPGMATPKAIPNPYNDWYEANDVNAAGTIAARSAYVGYLFQPGPTPADAGVVTQVPAPPNNNRNATFGITNTGLVLACRDNGQNFQNYVWDRGTGSMTFIPNAYNWCSGKINDSGLAVASADPGAGGAAWLWNQNSQTVTGVPSLGGITVGTDINASGIVVGHSQVGGRRHALRWTPGQATAEDLGTLGGLESVAMGINSSGLIVGWSFTTSGVRHAFIWDPGTRRMTDIGALPGYTESTANDINDSGMIVGASGPQGGSHATRWTPIP